MKSKGQRPFSSTRAVRVFWHFLPEIKYWRPLTDQKFEYRPRMIKLTGQRFFSYSILRILGKYFSFLGDYTVILMQGMKLSIAKE